MARYAEAFEGHWPQSGANYSHEPLTIKAIALKESKTAPKATSARKPKTQAA